jgi:defect-in-organelle-trafficking protein DotC
MRCAIHNSRAPIVLAFAVLWSIAGVAQTRAPKSTQDLDRVLQITSSSPQIVDEISYARQQVLREAAVGLGARAGLADRSRELLIILDARGPQLDQRFNFNSLVIGNSVLPPAISESKDVVAIENDAMRTAAGVFRIDEHARFAMPTPTWRNWLYMGLDSSPVVIPSLGINGPSSEAERRLWKTLVKEGYEAGRSQAQAVFDANLAHLERAHSGMVRYFDLWQRGMVSAPVIATASDVVIREDSQTISVGTTLRRITQPADFQPQSGWMPLE